MTLLVCFRPRMRQERLEIIRNSFLMESPSTPTPPSKHRSSTYTPCIPAQRRLFGSFSGRAYCPPFSAFPHPALGKLQTASYLFRRFSQLVFFIEVLRLDSLPLTYFLHLIQGGIYGPRNFPSPGSNLPSPGSIRSSGDSDSVIEVRGGAVHL